MKEGRGFLLVLVVTAVLYLPLLRLGFLADFFWFLPMEDPDPSWAPNVVDFATARERWSACGLDAWWAPAAFRWALWRPLSNALLELQWQFFGAEGMGYHGLSLGLYLLLLLPVWRLYRGFLNPLPALLALGLFAAHFGHLQSIWFHSNQHSLLSVLPGLLALLAHRHGREGGGRRWGLVALLLLVLALASGESALGMVSYFLAYELFVSKDTFQKRAASLVPVVALCGLYLVAHSALGYQTRGSLVYLDPAAEPLAFVRAVGDRLPALIAGTFNVLPADIWSLRPELRPLQALAAGVVVVQVGALLWMLWAQAEEREKAAIQLGLGGLLPACASFPGGRLLLGASIGSALVLGVLIQVALRKKERSFRLLLGPLLGMNVILMPALLLRQTGKLAELDAGLRRAAEEAEIDPTREVVVVTLPNADLAYNLLSARQVLLGAPPPVAWWLLSAAPFDHRLSRPAADRLEIEVQGGQLLGPDSQRLFRPPSWPIRAGNHFQQSRMQVEVLEADRVGPRRVAFTFATSLDDPRYQVLAWQEGALRRLALPAVGQNIRLPRSDTPYSF